MPECPFFVGQKVTPCVRELAGWAYDKGIRMGVVYTIKAIGTQPLAGDHPNEVVIWIDVPNYNDHGEDLGWYWKCFKPVTDISVFEKLLKSAPTPVKQKEPGHV